MLDEDEGGIRTPLDLYENNTHEIIEAMKKLLAMAYVGDKTERIVK